MKPNWSKAPEGATHHCSARNAWFKQDENDMWLIWQAYVRFDSKPLIGWCFCHAPDGSDVTTKAWTGEGLPPVGIEIEVMMPGLGNTTYFWQRAKVVHSALPDSPGEILVFSLETSRPAWADEFRPVRTPEQIAFEARDNAVKEMLSVWNSGFEGHVKDGLYALYDANYRKQTAP